MTPRSRQNGFTYAMVLVAIIVIGILAEAANLSTGRMLQADREAELLFRGMAYRRAIQSYFETHGRFPQQPQDLIQDPSSASRRHLRALYRDPFSAKRNEKGLGWTLVEAADGGFSGIASRYQGEPLKRANFPAGLEKFKDAETYADWVFRFDPKPQLNTAPIRIPPPPTEPVVPPTPPVSPVPESMRSSR